MIAREPVLRLGDDPKQLLVLSQRRPCVDSGPRGVLADGLFSQVQQALAHSLNFLLPAGFHCLPPPTIRAPPDFARMANLAPPSKPPAESVQTPPQLEPPIPRGPRRALHQAGLLLPAP